MIESPTGRPSTSPSGMLSCGVPSVPAIVVSVLTGTRFSQISERGRPRNGAGNGVVGRQTIVASFD